MSTDTSQVPITDENTIEETEEITTIGTKRRRSTSKVWEHFVKVKGPNGEDLARCKYCKKNFVGGGKGTSHLKKHIEDSRCQVLKQMKDNATSLVLESTPKVAPFKFDSEKSRIDYATMIIKHKYPFNMAHHKYFKRFCNGLNPNFKVLTRNTVRDDVLCVQEMEREKLYKYLDGLSCKIALTTDIWTSDHQNIAYICLTSHFISDDWELKKKILAYRKIDYPHDGITLSNVIKQLILDWNIDKKVISMVVDNAANNDVMIRHLKNWLNEKQHMALDGDLFHVRCSAHILNLVVQDGLKVIIDFISKIRESVRYIARSSFAKQRFDLAVQQLKIEGRKKIPMDVPTRWNSTYQMLDVAVGFKEVFNRLHDMDQSYKHNPSEEEWKVATVVKDCLKVFYNATNHFSGTSFPTSNVFFLDICEIRLQLKEWENSGEECLRKMAGPMKNKFEKYWEGCSSLLEIAVIFDPRFKLKVIEYYFGKLYGDRDKQMHVDRVRNAFIDLFFTYRVSVNTASVSNEVGLSTSRLPLSPSISSTSQGYPGFFDWYSQVYASHAYTKTEVEEYLHEPLFLPNEKFNILDWWKMNGGRLPTLARMARDILAVPATTVASEAAFSIGGRVIDERRSCLKPKIVEALVTADDWIESCTSDAENLEDLEEPDED